MDEHTSHEQAYKNGYEKGKQDAMKWIPVTERLPDGYEGVLVYGQMQDHYRACYYDPYCREFFTMDDRLVGRVTHWMPLPTPPKGE